MRNFEMFSRIFPAPARTLQPKMAAESHKSPLPAWIVLPFLFAATVAVLATWGTGSLLLGLATACRRRGCGGMVVRAHAARRRRAIAQIAGGDRYAALPAADRRWRAQPTAPPPPKRCGRC